MEGLADDRGAVIRGRTLGGNRCLDKRILTVISGLGYVRRQLHGVAEMHAVKLADPSERHIARVVGGDGLAEDNR